MKNILLERKELRKKAVADLIRVGSNFEDVIGSVYQLVDPEIDKKVAETLIKKLALTRTAKTEITKSLKNISYEINGLAFGLLLRDTDQNKQKIAQTIEKTFGVKMMGSESYREYADRFLSTFLVRTEKMSIKAHDRAIKILAL